MKQSGPTQPRRWFFTKSVHNLLVSLQAAQLSIRFLLRKIGSAEPPWGTWLRTHFWGMEREKAQHPAGIELTSFAVQLCALLLSYTHYPAEALIETLCCKSSLLLILKTWPMLSSSSEQAQRDGDGVRPGEELRGLRPRQHGPGGQENQRRPLRSQHNGGEDLLFETKDLDSNPGSYWAFYWIFE